MREQERERDGGKERERRRKRGKKEWKERERDWTEIYIAIYFTFVLLSRALLDHHVLIKEDGVDHNVIKIKPPLCFNKENADSLINALDQSLAVIHSADKEQ